ncbi:hypothetical protein G5V59_13730 [Nocardioides sp. W3-2-3]|uniref:ABC transporter permease n=1 Tax=Nocardioides convexus TaxID=2712224 RepID=UPI002418B769|nr:ABC transporter permease [Nocardioides convexus]NHA00708.1 hypothetical protein [Nocardioides convexus]
MSDVWLVARREIESRIRSKGFLLGLLASTVAVVAFVVVPSLIGEDDYTVALVGTTSKEARARGGAGSPTRRACRSSLVTDQDEAAARKGVEDGDLDAVVLDDDRLLTEGEPDGALSALLDSAHQSLTVQDRLTGLGLSAAQQQSALSVAPLSRETVGDEAADSGARTGLALLLMVALLMLLMTSAIGVAIGVVEEKGNRIVEILLVAVRPWQAPHRQSLLAFGLLGTVQARRPRRRRARHGRHHRDDRRPAARLGGDLRGRRWRLPARLPLLRLAGRGAGLPGVAPGGGQRRARSDERVDGRLLPRRLRRPAGARLHLRPA